MISASPLQFQSSSQIRYTETGKTHTRTHTNLHLHTHTFTHRLNYPEEHIRQQGGKDINNTLAQKNGIVLQHAVHVSLEKKKKS